VTRILDAKRFSVDPYPASSERRKGDCDERGEARFEFHRVDWPVTYLDRGLNMKSLFQPTERLKESIHILGTRPSNLPYHGTNLTTSSLVTLIQSPRPIFGKGRIMPEAETELPWPKIVCFRQGMRCDEVTHRKLFELSKFGFTLLWDGFHKSVDIAITTSRIANLK
jgi:hypothetical protein